MVWFAAPGWFLNFVIISNRSIPLPQTSGLLFLGETSAPPFYLKNLGVKLLHGLISQTLEDFSSHPLLPSSPVRLKEKGVAIYRLPTEFLFSDPGALHLPFPEAKSRHCDQPICAPPRESHLDFKPKLLIQWYPGCPRGGVAGLG